VCQNYFMTSARCAAEFACAFGPVQKCFASTGRSWRIMVGNCTDASWHVGRLERQARAHSRTQHGKRPVMQETCMCAGEAGRGRRSGGRAAAAERCLAGRDHLRALARAGARTRPRAWPAPGHARRAHRRGRARRAAQRCIYPDGGAGAGGGGACCRRATGSEPGATHARARKRIRRAGRAEEGFS